MYQNGLIVYLVKDGCTDSLKEWQADNGTSEILCPYGTDYNLVFKNNSFKRAVITSLKIDGTEVIDAQLLIDKNSTYSLKGVLKDNNVRNSFRFVERTERIESFRGCKPEDSLISVTFQFEFNVQEWIDALKKQMEENDRRARKYVPPAPIYPPLDEWVNPPSYPREHPWNTYGTLTEYSLSDAAVNYSQAEPINQGILRSASLTNSADTGITVPGKASEQHFQSAQCGALENEVYNMVFRLIGKIQEKPVTQTVTKRTVIQCRTCGTMDRNGSTYCGHCGRNLLAD